MPDTAAQAVIDRFAAWMKVQNLSQSAAAKLADCSAATLSQVLSGKYAGDTARMVDKMQRALDRSDRRAKAPKRPGLVMTSVCEEVLTTLRNAHDEGVMAVVMGPSGVGKTSAATLYAKSEPETIFITLRPAGRKGIHGSGKAFLTRLGAALDIEYGYSDSQMDVVDAIGEALKGSGRLLVIDEIDYAAEDTLQCIRMIHDISQTGIVMLATMAFLERLKCRKSATLAQFLNRVAYCCRVSGLTSEDADLILSHYQLDRAALATARQGAHGVARRLIHGITGAVRLAGQDGGKLDAKTIASAYAQLMEV